MKNKIITLKLTKRQVSLVLSALDNEAQGDDEDTFGYGKCYDEISKQIAASEAK